jgi:hypothetical protein
VATKALTREEQAAFSYVDPQACMRELTRSFEAVRKLFRENPNWSDDDAVLALADLAGEAMDFRRKLQSRKNANDQNRLAKSRKLGPVISPNFHDD